MPENRKYFVHNQVHLITARTEEGLPIVASLVLNMLIWGILAKAKHLYDIKVCHFLFMGNHFHMLIVVDNPEHVSGFIGYVKAETAHTINRLLGRKRKTVWLEGYDSPVLLTPDDVKRYIEYIYTNPDRANLVESIDHYPGVSSWELYKNNQYEKSCLHISRDDIYSLPLPALSINEQQRLVEIYQASISMNYDFVLEPDAWVDCFDEMEGISLEALKMELLANIYQAEEELRKQRAEKKRSVIGSTTLRRQSMLKEHTPKKHSKRMICISSNIDLRVRFINHFKELCAIAEHVYKRWKLGELHLPIPEGLFAPRVPTLVVSMPLTL